MTEEVEREVSVTVPALKEHVIVERHDGPVTLRLLDAALWEAFKQEGTEMIITKAGRRMFPFVMVTLEGLSPTLLYSVYLSLVPCDSRQYKFCQRRWVSVSDSAPGPTPTPDQPYVHPASPNRGSFWCQEMISFAKLKITNNKHSQGDIVLQSMRKYMAQITVCEDLGDVQYVFPLPETTFVAVTQYQNEAVTRMKIAHNPFANGFKSEEGKKLFSRSDLSRSQDSKHKSGVAGGKLSTKTARVKATVAPQALAAVLHSQHEDRKPASHLLPLSLPSHSILPLDLTALLPRKGDTDFEPQEDSALPRGFPVPSTVAVPPYVVRGPAESHPLDPSHSADGDLKEGSLSVSGCPPSGDGSRPHEACSREGAVSVYDDEEDDGEDVSDSASPDPVPPGSLPTTVTDREEDEHPEDCEDNATPGDDLSAGDGQLVPITGPAQSESLASPAAVVKREDTFKQPPLPRKSAPGGKKGGKRTQATHAGTSGSGGTDVDLSWYRNALHQASQRQQQEPAVRSDRGVVLKLHDGHIWHSFAACGSKMVVSKEGRHMFPVVSVSLRGLDPGRLYSVWLHVSETEDVTCSHGGDQGLSQWDPVSAGRRPGPVGKPYMHPCSPMRGLAWMKVKVTFNEVKLTSDASAENAASFVLLCGRRYLTQVVVREEEEATPNGAGGAGDLFFFPLPEVTFVTQQDNDDVLSPFPVTSATLRVNELRKRARDSGNSTAEEDTDEVEESSPPSPKSARADVVTAPWLSRPPAVVPRSSDLSAMLSHPSDISAMFSRPSDISAMLSRPSDISALLSRPSDMPGMMPRSADLCGRLNPVYCYPPISSLPPAHVGLLANRMPPLSVASPLQSITSFPFPPQLFPQLRTPMHSAFGMSLPPFNPFPYFYYPYSVPPVTPATTIAEVSRGLDLSVKPSESR